MTRINLNTEAGVKLVEFVNTPIDGYPNSTIPASELVIGDYTGSGATMLELMFDAIPMTKAQYDDIVAFKGEATSRVAGEPYTPPESNLAKIVGLQGLALETAERVSRLEQNGYAYTSFALKGTVISGFSGVRSKNICKYDLAKGYRFEQRPYSTDVEDSRHIVTLVTAGLGNIVFLTANSGEIGRIETALTDGTDITSIAHTSE